METKGEELNSLMILLQLQLQVLQMVASEKADYREVATGLSDLESTPASRTRSLQDLCEVLSRQKDSAFPPVKFEIVPDAKFNSAGDAAHDIHRKE